MAKINYICKKVKMKILVTNDDGYEAGGISELVEILRPYGDLTVVAPKRPQSGMSMAVSMGLRPIAVKKLEEGPGLRRWYLDGTPASCIKYGLDNIFWPGRPDLVVSGINHGSNAATAALYSGTLGAAAEGALNGIPSIGVSLDSFSRDADFSLVRSLLPGILDRLLPDMSRRRGTYYNINFPGCGASGFKGIVPCHMGKAHWEREYRPYRSFLEEIGHEPDVEALGYLEAAAPGEEIYVMAGDFTDDGDNVYPSDHQLLEQGYVTVTPQNIDNTDYGELERLGGMFGK